jgi:hypothetical protein
MNGPSIVGILYERQTAIRDLCKYKDSALKINKQIYRKFIIVLCCVNYTIGILALQLLNQARK